MDMTEVKLKELSKTDRDIYYFMPTANEITAKAMAELIGQDNNHVAAAMSRLRAAGFITSRKQDHGREQLHLKQLFVLVIPQEHLVQRTSKKDKAISEAPINDQIDDIIGRLELLKTSVAGVVDIAEKAKQFELLMKSAKR